MSGMEAQIEHVSSVSPFFAETLAQNPALFPAAALDAMAERLADDALIARYDAFLEEHEGDLQEQLRALRKREMARIIFRDLTRAADFIETTRELSCLAEYCIGRALAHCHAEVEAKYAPLRLEDGTPDMLTVLAMGKFGARELNLSSDVDLIFLYDGEGDIEAANGKRVTRQEFHLRVARQLIALLDTRGASGYVFRVDMRLRPFGDSGPLVSHRIAMEKYYMEHGRDWERYAFVKARPVAGNLAFGEEFLQWMRPFVYRRHLDYGAVQSLREMKRLMTRQAEIKNMDADLKLGPGGIREIEFIAQAQQLVWGGRNQDLQERCLLPALEKLSFQGLVSDEDEQTLVAAYVFLRNSEHAIQAEHDKQTHSLPSSDESRERIAKAMGFANYTEYSAALEVHREAVTSCFGRLLNENTAEGIEDPAKLAPWRAVWENPEGSTSDALPAEAMAPIVTLKQEAQELELSEVAMQRVDALMPIVLMYLAESDNPTLGATRLLPILLAILRRSTYLVFLQENLDALRRTIALIQVSPWITEQLENYPLVLFDLTDRGLGEAPITADSLDADLRALLRTLDRDDLEGQMDTLRQFKLGTMVRVAAKELLSEFSVMEASDALTVLAEVLLEASLDFAWQHVEAKHGMPADEQGEPILERLAIIAYGKAGGIELAYGSDLDLVFLCPSDIGNQTDGEKSIHNGAFYHRLGQRLIHILTSSTRFGTLYNVDMRLRPQGNKGPMVATISAFERYLESDAWTWEKQALVRARFVAGDFLLAGHFKRIRESVLRAAGAKENLKQDVVDMRAKMREHLSSDAGPPGAESLGTFDLKHDEGAIVDIEFMVQYAVLAFAAEHEGLTAWTDVMRLLGEMANAEVFSPEEVATMQRAYLAFRASVHYNWLGLAIDFDALQGARQDVFAIWKARMADSTG